MHEWSRSFPQNVFNLKYFSINAYLWCQRDFHQSGCHMFFSVAILRGSSSSDIMLVIASGHHSPAPRCKLKFQRHAPTSAREPNETEMRCRKKKRKSDPLSLWEKQSRSGRWRSSYLSALHHTHTGTCLHCTSPITIIRGLQQDWPPSRQINALAASGLQHIIVSSAEAAVNADRRTMITNSV